MATEIKVDRAQSDRAYGEMFAAAKERLEKKDPAAVAQNTGAIWEPEASLLRLSTLGEEIAISWPTCTEEPQLENWHHLVLLHYLDLADGTPLAGRPMAMGEMKDGMIRGAKFDLTAERSFGRFLRGKNEEQILAVLESLGGTRCSGKGDITMKIPFFPMLPVYLNIWLADDEFPASGKMLVDASADHYMMIEDAVTVGEILFRRMETIHLRG